MITFTSFILYCPLTLPLIPSSSQLLPFKLSQHFHCKPVSFLRVAYQSLGDGWFEGPQAPYATEGNVFPSFQPLQPLTTCRTLGSNGPFEPLHTVYFCYHWFLLLCLSPGQVLFWKTTQVVQHPCEQESGTVRQHTVCFHHTYPERIVSWQGQGPQMKPELQGINWRWGQSAGTNEWQLQ